MGIEWKTVSKREPCGICAKDDWCATSEAGLSICRRVSSERHRIDKSGVQYWIHGVKYTSIKFEAKQNLIVQRRTLPSTNSVHDVYDRMLDLLPLNDMHRRNLLQRGFSPDQIELRKYRSLTNVGRERVCRELSKEKGSSLLERIPGFNVEVRDNRRLISLKGVSGLLVPIRNIYGLIIAIKIRSYPPANPTWPCSKYSYLSSKRFRGNGPGAPIHFPLGFRNHSTEIIRITEGELKSDLALCKTKVATLSVPGVGAWRSAAAEVAILRPKRVRLAFDSDFRTNPIVAVSLMALFEQLKVLNVKVEVETWV